MSDFTLTFNTVEIVGAAESVWDDANKLLGREFQKRITSNIWAWPHGESPRDIVDLGQLRDSYDPQPITPTVYQHPWATEYALAVHEGARRKTASLPARPWVRVTLREYDFADAYAKLAAAEMRKRTAGK